MSKTLAVIPARGGSKRIPNKNLRIINGKPLLFYAIRNALDCPFIDEVVVSSDDNEILEYASRFNVYVRKRPTELGKANVTLDPVVYDALRFMEEHMKTRYETVVTLQPTSPLLKVDTLNRAIKKFMECRVDTLISAVDATHLYWKKNGEGYTPDYHERLNRQWLPKRFKETGAFLISRRSILTKRSRIGKFIDLFIVDESEAIDIDTPLEWFLAENLMKRRKIAFVVVGGKEYGTGHVYRSLAIANRLLGHEILFVAKNCEETLIKHIKSSNYDVLNAEGNDLGKTLKKIGVEIVVNDILDTDANYVQELKRAGLFVVNFEDLGKGADIADLVFNALYEKTDPPKNHRFGHQYVCLNQYFYLQRARKPSWPPKVLFVSFGGVDQNDLTGLVAEMLPELKESCGFNRFIIATGLAYPRTKLLEKTVRDFGGVEVHRKVKNMAKLMAQADLSITSNGRTIYELTAMGVPIVSIAQNERETMHLFSRYHPGIAYLGLASSLNKDKLLNKLKEISGNPKLFKEMAAAQESQSEKIRGGIMRVINEILWTYNRWENEKDR